MADNLEQKSTSPVKKSTIEKIGLGLATLATAGILYLGGYLTGRAVKDRTIEQSSFLSSIEPSKLERKWVLTDYDRYDRDMKQRHGSKYAGSDGIHSFCTDSSFHAYKGSTNEDGFRYEAGKDGAELF